jgi:geranylgeranyl diphosphate synthase, type I
VTQLHALADQIKSAMSAAIPQPADPDLRIHYQIMEYHLGWRDEHLAPASASPGKLTRPTLSVLACVALGGDVRHALPLAAAIQLLHDFTLIHDDIEDHSAQRRGRTTVWKLWGEELAINVGDGMFAVAHRALYGLRRAGVAPATVLAVVEDFEETILRIVEGQHLDMTGEGRFDISEDRYLAMIGGKTAALIAAATRLGARLATDDARSVGAMSDFGQALGLAFQMHDDLLDIWGDPQKTGKPRAADLVQRKMSLPMVYSYARAGDDRSAIERIYRQSEVNEEDIDTLLAILERTEARPYVTALTEREHARALAALDSITPRDAEAYAMLRSVTDALLQRTW